MKLLSKFKNRYNNITYKVYETKNGIKVLHLDNPATIDFDFAIVFKAGSSFELKEKVPKGTAHFLEHMLLNPNEEFRSKEEIDMFEQGSKSRPTIDINATTTRKNIYFTSHTNRKGTKRALKRVESIISFSKKIFAPQLEKERGIILAEKSRKPRKEKDSSLLSLEFLFKDNQEEFSYDILGEASDIKKITIDDLERYYNSRFVSGNCVFAIQSNGTLDKEMVEEIERIAKKIPSGKADIPRVVKLSNQWRVGAFNDDRANGIYISFSYFEEQPKKTDYKEYAIKYITFRLLHWLAFDILREKKSLIYDFSTAFIVGLSYHYDIRGFNFTTEKEKFENTLSELYTILYTDSYAFLDSKKGKLWFNDAISLYLFPRSIRFNSDLAEDTSTALLEDIEIFNANLSVREAKTITIEDIKKYLTVLINTPPHIWAEGDMQEEELIKIVNNSLFGKKFGS